MNKRSLTKFLIKTALISLSASAISLSQIREYRIHDRGMLHETEFNTGEIGRGWEYGSAGNKTDIPLMEWPSNSKTVVNGIEYSGQENILGAGVYIAANLDGKPGVQNRRYALCGGVGASTPEVVFGRWSFPISIEKIDNFPVLPDGKLNPDYNPNEAEQIIKASWASSIGITVTRVSRQWSFPDYDDLIIYEYTFVYNGDTDGNPATIEQDTTLKDAMITFIYGFAPSMFGYQRQYGSWLYTSGGGVGIYRGDQRGFWDARYWLAYNMDVQTNSDPGLAGKPEPDPNLFMQYARTGINGGAIESPQAPGYCILYYDTNHLAIVDPIDSTRNESEAVKELSTYQGEYYELDQNDHILQPWSNKISTPNTNSTKMEQYCMNPDSRWSGVYKPNSTAWPDPPKAPNGNSWIGRAAYPYRQSADAGQKETVFGPYTLHLGDTLHYSLAEVVGYGAQPGDRVEGGQTNTEWTTNPSWDRPYVINGQKMTDHYLTDFGYPDYVNSKIRNVTQVAAQAFKAYLGKDSISVPVWPEDDPRHGSYKIPIPVPAPAITISNTAKGDVKINWSRDVEDFTAPRLMGTLESFNVYRSISGMGPWELLKSINKGDVNSNNMYEYLDTDPNFKIGESRYYAVTSVDNHGNMSGKTNIIKIQKNIGSVSKLGKVYAVPNPFIAKSGFSGGGQEDKRIGFYGLPEKCTIRIFSYSGQLVQTIEHDAPIYSAEWFQVTSNTQEIASGIYFYVVTTPDGQQTTGKFIVIK